MEIKARLCSRYVYEYNLRYKSVKPVVGDIMNRGWSGSKGYFGCLQSKNCRNLEDGQETTSEPAQISKEWSCCVIKLAHTEKLSSGAFYFPARTKEKELIRNGPLPAGLWGARRWSIITHQQYLPIRGYLKWQVYSKSRKERGTASPITSIPVRKFENSSGVPTTGR